MFKQLSVKEAYDTERNFTEVLSKNHDWLNSIMALCGLSPVEKADSEVHTIEGKRIDVVCKTESDGIVVIEHQDCAGLLDANHVGKSFMYALDKEAKHNILMCEDVSANLKRNIRMMNLHPNFNTYVIKTQLFKTDDSGYHFVPVLLESPDLKARARSARKTVADNTELQLWFEKALELMDANGFKFQEVLGGFMAFSTLDLSLDNCYEMPWLDIKASAVSIYINRTKTTNPDTVWNMLKMQLDDPDIKEGSGGLWLRIYIKINKFNYTELVSAVEKLGPIFTDTIAQINKDELS